MEITMYPPFNEVFFDNNLLGIFYPLCSVNKNLHFVSSNGFWMDEQYETNYNTLLYTRFELDNSSRYCFKGDIRLYKGYEYAKIIYPILERDFTENGKNYLHDKVKTENYILLSKKLIPIETKKDIDLNYYLQTFYEFNINKLNYTLNEKFGEFNRLFIEGLPEENSPIVYEDADSMEEVEEVVEDNIDLIKDHLAIGKVVGDEFFTDGNDTALYFNKKENTVLLINYYS